MKQSKKDKSGAVPRKKRPPEKVLWSTRLDSELYEAIRYGQHGRVVDLADRAIRREIDFQPDPDDPQNDDERDLVKEMLDLHRAFVQRGQPRALHDWLNLVRQFLTH